MGEGGWRGLGKDEVHWCGQLSADKLIVPLILVKDFTSGSVLFAGASGLISQDNTNLFWDDSNNRLGIGDSTPNVTLKVMSTSTSGAMQVINNDSGERGLEFGGAPAAGPANYIKVVGTTYPLYFMDNSSNVNMTILDSGNVGIGTTIPGALLEISGGGILLPYNTEGINFRASNASIQEVLTYPANLLYLNNPLGGSSTAIGSANVERIRLDSSGNVGFGTTTPNQLLSLSGGAFASNNTTAPTLTLTQVSGAFFISGGAFFYKGDKGTVTELAPR